jgi:hypothetical protein
MRFFRDRLFSFVPLGLLPLMDMSVDQVGPYVRGLGPQFRQFVAEFIIQQISSIAGSIIVSLTRLFFSGGGV